MSSAEQVEVQGLLSVLEDACADWPDNQTVRIGFVAREWRLILSSLRSPPQGGDQGAEAMREACARWHEDQAAEYAREASERTLPNGDWSGRDAMWARADAQAHREYADAIRALPAAPQPHIQSEGAGE